MDKKRNESNPKPKCGLCGNIKNALTKTPCCNNTICDSTDSSCYRNHELYTLCSHHFTKKHEGVWQNCEKCKADFDTRTYIVFGKDYNFEPVKNPEKFSISCSNCGDTFDTLDAFPVTTSVGDSIKYYCTKKKCQKVGCSGKPIIDYSKPKCGLCGSRKEELTKTPCCRNWICDSTENSCYRNHELYTLCSHHFTKKHEGVWQNCEKCEADFDTRTFVTFGTDYNFEPLKNPEKISISCSNCGDIFDTLDAFPVTTSIGDCTKYYCTKKKCQMVGNSGKPKKDNSGKSTKDDSKPKCGLCGNRKEPLTKTPCCDNWICDDEHKYVLFSYARNSCHRNHRRYTLCAYHFNENHEGTWQSCKKCKADFDTPTYVTFGTKYNFEPLENPEKFSVACDNCGDTYDRLDAFPLTSVRGCCTRYYCAKKKCQKAGSNDTAGNFQVPKGGYQTVFNFI